MTRNGERGLSIGELARRGDCTVQTVRYYEQVGILAKVARSDGNQRVYAEQDALRLTFVRHARELGFSLPAIRDLLKLTDNRDQSCAEADAIARRHLAEVEVRLDRLMALRQELQRMTEQCRGGRIDDCRVIEALSNHALCSRPHH